MLTNIGIQQLYLTGVIITAIILLLFNKYVNVIKKRSNRFVFNHRIIESFETWLNNNITMNITRYLEEKMGSELKKEEELNINGEFAQKGVDTVSAALLTQMPIFYYTYMVQFYGEDRMIVAIREKVRYLFIRIIESMVKKRMNGGVIVDDNKET